MKSPEINLFIYGQLIFFLQSCQDNSLGERTVLATVVLGPLAIHMGKNEVGPLLNAIYKNELKMDQT